MMTQYLRDQHGVDWPITGHWCITCGWPLTPIRPGQTAHPWCEFREELDDSSTADVVFALTRELGARPLPPEEND